MFKSIRKYGVAAKLGMGYASVTLLLIGAVGTTIWQVKKTATVTNRIIDLRAPTAQASLAMMNGMNHSLAALRGWMILGKDKFEDERATAWSMEIEPALSSMKKFAVNWTDPKNIERLDEIEQKLGDFKTYQREIEDIAQTVENTPATKILFQQAAPRAKILAANITKMIDLEAELDATPERKALLGMMADTRGTLGLGLGAIRAYLLSGNESFKEQFDTLWAKNTRRFGDLTNNLHLLSPEQREAYDAFAKARAEFDPLPPQMFEIRGSEEWNLANRWLGTKAAPTAFTIKENLDGMIASQQQLRATDMAEGKRLTAMLMSVEWVLLGVGVVLCTILGIVNTRSITRPFKEIFKGLKNMSSDELEETGKTFNRIIQGMTESVGQVKDAAGQVSSASQQFAEASSEQASSLEETSSALEEMAAMAQTSASNAKAATSAANTANDSTEVGKEAMEAITSSSGKVSKIIKVIEEIAFQTNLLALNAAVEAARAGEHGKGFAVVADEVRNLAQRAAKAAGEITELIDSSVQDSRQGQTAVDGIAQGIGEVTDLIAGISKASEEQAQGVDQVNAAVAQMNKVTQQNAAGAEESASAAEELNAQAYCVMELVGELVLLTQGADSRGSTTRASGPASGSKRPSGVNPSPGKRDGGGTHEQVPVHAGASGSGETPRDFPAFEGDDLQGF